MVLEGIEQEGMTLGGGFEIMKVTVNRAAFPWGTCASLLEQFNRAALAMAAEHSAVRPLGKIIRFDSGKDNVFVFQYEFDLISYDGRQIASKCLRGALSDRDIVLESNGTANVHKPHE